MGAMVTAGVGGATMAWGNLRSIFSRLESLVIVKAELSGNMKNHFMDYCWKHFKSSPFGVRRFYAGDYFIKTKNRFGRVATEDSGKFVTFWKNKFPLFVSITEDKSGNRNDGSIDISFIRGTFDLEQLLIDSVHFYDNFKHEGTNYSSRYYVKRCFGRKAKRDKSDDDHDPMGQTARQPSQENCFRPLFYSKDDIGVPTSKKAMDSLSYDSNVQEFYEEVRRWKDSKDWFKDKGLPWRLGAGFFGPPGTGKTSLARAIGQSLDLPIHSYDLTTMDNEELVENWQKSLGESPCIVLLEDIDRIFDEKKQIKTANDKSPLTLDCLLNCISGVQPSDGIIVLVTANDVSKLDTALGVPDKDGKSTRPGRLDRALHIGILDKDGRIKIAKRILSDCPELIEQTVSDGDGETGAQFESRCSKLALDKYWGRLKNEKA